MPSNVTLLLVRLICILRLTQLFRMVPKEINRL